MIKKLIILNLFILAMLSCEKEEQSIPNAAGKPNENYKVYTFEINGNLGKPLETNVSVEKGDFIFVEVIDKIKLGPIAGFSFGDGIPGNTQYNKYNYKHGSLITLVAGKDYQTTKISSLNHPLYYQMLDGAKLANGEYLPCSYFFSDDSGNLSFEINDTDYTNNSGSYKINLYHLEKNGDIGRNTFNKCPKKEPANGKDCDGETWIYEGIKGWFYHGIFNDAYRGTGKNSGCQCVYDDGELVISHQDQGTFDYGFWEYQGKVDDIKSKHLHLILDVIPHDEWSGTKNYNDSKVICR